MQKQYVCFIKHFNKIPVIIALSVILVILASFSGCTSHEPASRQYSVAEDGRLTLNFSESPVSTSIIEKNANYTIERLVFHTPHGEVYGILGIPNNKTIAGFVHAPGAGVKKEGHINRMKPYLQSGYSYLVLDIRGQGGETEGYPLDFKLDFQKFANQGFPQYYDNILDMLEAAQYLRDRTQVPVMYIGASNGGRYAIIAAALDSASRGVIAVSTSGFDREGDQYTGIQRKFLLSIDPDTYLSLISPRNTFIFHSKTDPIIPFDSGTKLFSYAKDPKEFLTFNGTHGINEETDQLILQRLAQLYHN